VRYDRPIIEAVGGGVTCLLIYRIHRINLSFQTAPRPSRGLSCFAFSFILLILLCATVRPGPSDPLPPVHPAAQPATVCVSCSTLGLSFRKLVG